MKPRRILSAARLSLPFATALVALFYASHAHAQTRTWIPTASVVNGAWGTTTNWSGSDVPDTNVEIASFSADFTGSAPTFALGADRTVNAVIYNDTGASGDITGSIVAGSTLILSGTTPKITTTNSLTINSILNWGASGLAKDGPVTLTLTGNNTGTGVLTLSAGIIRATTSVNALGTGAATLSLAASTTLQLANDTALNFARATTVTGNMTITSDRLAAGAGVTHTLGTLSIGTQTLSITRGANATSGTGGITFGAVSPTGNPTFSLGANSLLTLPAITGTARNLTFDGSGAATITGVIGTTTGTLVVNGGTVTLASGNTFTGAVTVDGSGVIVAPGNNGAAADPTALGGGEKFINLTNGGTVRITSNSNPTSTNVKKFNFGTGGGNLDINNAVTLTLDDNTGATAQLQGSGDLTKIGPGNLALGYSGQAAGGFSGFTGNILVNAGSLLMGHPDALGSSVTGTTTIASGAALAVAANSFSPLVVAENLTLSGLGVGSTGALLNAQSIPTRLTGTVTLNANTSIGVTGTGGLTIDGAIGGGAFDLTKIGVGALTLGGANTYTGATIVNAGTLVLSGSLPTGRVLTVSPILAGGAAFSLAGGTANPLPNVSALTIGSVTGPTIVGLELGANAAASDSIITPNAATTAGTVNLSIMSLAGFGSASSYDLISAPSGLSGASYVLASAPGGYTYSLSTSDTLVTLNVSPAAVTGDFYWRGNTNNSWGGLSGANTNWYSDAAGSTNAQSSPTAGDTVNFSTINALGPAITTTLDGNYTVKRVLFGSSPNGVTAVTVAGGATPAAFGTLSIAPTSTADGINVASNAGAVTISAPVLLGTNQTWTVDGTGANGSSLTVSGAVTGTGTLDISGLVTLSAPGTSTYNGATTVPNGGILRGGATNSFSAASAMSVTGTGILRLNGFNNNAASLTGGGFVENSSATAATLAVGDGTNFTFSGTLQNGGTGTLGIAKTGAGILTLSGSNTYTGATTVTAGTLLQGSASAISTGTALTVNGTSTFDLNGFNASVSSLGGVATGVVTDIAPGAGTSTLAITAAGGSAVAITNGPSRTVALRVTNVNGGFFLTNGGNAFSGGIVLTNSAAGTRMSPGTITAGAYGTGAITIGESPSDLAGIFFATATQTLSNPITFNTAQGTDRVGIRSDVAGITLSGVITANLAPATFTSNNATLGAFTLTNQVTGAGGIVLDITSKSAAATQFLVALNNATINPNNYQGDTVINFNAATGKSATLQLLAPDQIPNGANAGNVIVNANGTGVGQLTLLAGGSETINGLSGSGNVVSPSGTGTLTLGDNNANGNHSGAINNTLGTLSVTKTGSGTQTLGGTSNFAGDLTVTGGLVAFTSSPATAGPLGNSTVVNLSGGGISHTASGANNLNRPIAIGASAGTVNVASSTGVLNLNTLTTITSTGGGLIKTGPGTLQIPASTTLNAGAAGVAVNDGTLQAGFGTAGVATISVGATGNLDQRNTFTEALTLGTTAGALTLAGGSQLGFDISGVNNDSIAVGVGGTAVTSGTVTLNFYGTPALGTYNLLTAPSGLSGATYALGAAPNGFNYTINASDTLVSVTVSATIPSFWRSGQNLSWNTLGSSIANWTTDAGGAVDATSKPVFTDTVIFSATGAPAGAVTTTLDAAFTIDSLQFTAVPGSTDVTIAAGTSGTLTLTPLSTSGGIRVLLNGGNATISAPLTIGAAQTWDVDTTGSLTVSGDTAFNAAVNKTNSGPLTLSGTNSGSAAITLTGGTLNINSATALGTGTFTIGAGTTINASVPTALTPNNVQNWNGDFTFTGTSNLDLGTGAVTLGNSLSLTAGASTLTVGGIIGDGGNNRGITKAGAGTVVLNGANSYTGPTAITGGVLRITQATGLGTSAGGVTQSGTSALELDGTGGAFTVGAEPLTINGGGITNLGALRNIAGDNTYGGTVTMGIQSRINSDSGTLTLSNPSAVTATNLTLVVGGAGNLNISGAITLGTGGVAKDSAGNLTLGGANIYTGATSIAGGALNLTGSITGNTTTSVFAYGTVAGNTVVNHSGNLTAFVTTGANIVGAVTVFNQTAGTVTIVPTNGADNQWVARTGYGALNITGGTFNTGRFDVTAPGGTNGVGVAYVGGTGTLNQNVGDWTILTRTNGNAQLTVGPGGTVTRASTVTAPFALTMDGTNSSATLNVAGGFVSTGTTRGLQVGFTTPGPGNTSFVNVASGTLAMGLNMIKAGTAGSTATFFNFAGGTMRSNAALTEVITPSGTGHAITSTIFGAIDNAGVANDFTGGVTIDTNGFATTYTNAFRAASGVGVTQADIGDVSLLGGNSGYIGAPAVTFSLPLAAGDDPASGYALISGGAVTGIVITNPGVYASGETPTITLTGGGGSIAPFATAALATNNVSGGLTKIGANTLTLSGANTYSGATLVSAGTLQLNSLAAVTPATSGITVGATGTLGFTAAAASTLDLTGKSMTLSGGTLNFDIGASGINDMITVQDFTLTANSAFTFNSLGGLSEGGSYTLLTSNNPITNSGPFTITPQTIGRVTLTPTINANTITVGSTLDEGEWGVDSGGNWSVAGNWTGYLPSNAGDAALFGAAITLPRTVAVDTPQIAGYMRFDNLNAYTIGANGSNFLTLNNGASNAVLAVTSGSHTIAENVLLASNLAVLPAASTTLTMSGTLSGVGRSVEVNGPGTVVLSGVNTYSGPITVRSGALTLSGARTVTAGVITVGNLLSTTATLNISNGTFTTGQFSVGSGDNAATAGIVNQTGGSLTMSSNQLLLGNGGTGTAAGSNSTGTYNLSGGTLNTVGGLGVLIGTNTGATGVFNLSSGGVLNMAPTSLMGIARSDNNLATNTTGTFTQTGGTATVGILQLAGSVAVNNAGGNATLSLTGGTFAATTFNALCGGNGSTAAITIGGTAQVTLPVFPVNAKGSGATAAITFDSTTGYLRPVATSATYLPAGTFTTAKLTANGAKFDTNGFDITIGQNFQDDSTLGTLTKSGIGTLTLTGVNAYTGATNVTQGTLAISNNSALGTTAGATTVSGTVAGETFLSLTPAAADLALAENLNLNGNAIGRATLTNNSALNHTLSGAIDVSSATNLSQLSSNGAGSITVSGDITGAMSGGAVLFLRGASTSATNRVIGSLNLTGGNLAKTDGGTWIVGAPGETYSWVNTTVAVGTLRMGFANVLPSTTVAIMGNSTGGSTGILDLNGFDQTIAGITYNDIGGSTGTRTITSATPAVLTVSNTGDFSPTALVSTVADSVRLTGALQLVKSGVGTLTLSGANTHTGGTAVNQGTLIVAGSGSIAGTASVAATGTLGGNGTVAGATTVAAAGTVSPGSNSVATLNFSSTLTLDAGSNYAVGITGAATNDRVNVTGALTANGNIVVTLSGYVPVANDTFDIADAPSVTGTPAFDFSAAVLTPGLTWDTTTFATDGKIKVISADPFLAWASDKGVVGGKGGDDDGDGVSNLLEFATNSNPKSGSSGARVYGKIHVISGSPVLTYTVATRAAAAFAANLSRQEATKDLVKYSIEGSNDLSTWSTVVVTEVTGVDATNVQAAIVPPLPTLDGGWEWHTFRTDGDTGSDPSDYIRLNVTEAP